MKDSIKTRKNLLALCLSVMMLTSVAALTACDSSSTTNSSSTSSSTTTEEKDDQLIKNGDFETFNEDNAINTTVTGWGSVGKPTSSTGTASTSSSNPASGVIDLSWSSWHNLTGISDKWAELTANSKTVSVLDARTNWDKFTLRDKLAYYDMWEADKANKDKKIAEELDFYESFNIKTKDIPDTDFFWRSPDYEMGENDEPKENKVLMIHNDYQEMGTAQKFTSATTVTVKAGTAAKLSVWVRTADLTCATTGNSAQEAVNKGAYISVNHSVGGKALDAYKVENINTQKEWRKFSFLLNGSSYADTTFTLELGLGQGGGSDHGDLVNGYAFFDSVEAELLSSEEYATQVAAIENDPHLVTFSSTAEEKTINASEKAIALRQRNVFAMDFSGAITENAPDTVLSHVDVSETKATYQGNPVDATHGLDGTNDVTKVYANAEAMAADTKAADVYEKYLQADTTFADKETLLLVSRNGVPYTVSPKTADNTTDYTFEVQDYLALSFFAKTSDMKGHTGASVTLIDGTNKTSFDNIDTSDIEPIEVNGTPLYGEWQRYFFFVKNDTDNATASFKLSFNFGPTSLTNNESDDDFFGGFAAFTNFQTFSMNEDSYASAQSGTYAKIVTLTAGKAEEITGNNFDSAANTPANALENGLANPQNYKGVSYNSAYVNGTGSTAVNANENAGLISKKYFTATDSKYYNAAAGTYAWLDGIKSLSTNTDATAVWKDVFGENCVQPLFLWNASASAYGYIGKSTSIAANTYTAVSVRVKGSDGAKAYVRLVDTDNASYDKLTAYNKVLSIGRNLTYWYDDEGNVCTGDPAEKSTQVAFKLQSNGLYKANPNWDGYKNLTKAQKDGYFANLKAYTKTDAEGNLLVAEGGASHDYTNYWNNAGVNGIAFYHKNGAYYAHKDGNTYKTHVNDLASIASLATRYTKQAANNKLEAEVSLSGEWTEITFYVHTGDSAKNYRLEVWNNDKTGAANAAGTYLIVDTNTPSSDETTIQGLISEYAEEVKDLDEDQITAGDNYLFNGVFSYFDTANHLRYDASLDEKGNGNLYEDNYVPSSYAEGIAFLKYAEGNSYTVFADYQYSEKTVAASEVEDDKEDDSTTDDETASETNIWLLISSLAIAGVLLLAIASIVIRKIVVNARKNRAAQASVKKHNKK